MEYIRPNLRSMTDNEFEDELEDTELPLEDETDEDDDMFAGDTDEEDAEEDDMM